MFSCYFFTAFYKKNGIHKEVLTTIGKKKSLYEDLIDKIDLQIKVSNGALKTVEKLTIQLNGEKKSSANLATNLLKSQALNDKLKQENEVLENSLQTLKKKLDIVSFNESSSSQESLWKNKQEFKRRDN